MNNQKKKVLIVITKSNFGGAQKYVFELAQNLKSRGYDVMVALGGEGLLISKLKSIGIPVVSVSSLGRDISIRNDIKSFFELIKIIRTVKPDVVHLNSSKIGGIGSLASKLCFVPQTVFTIHGWAFNEDRSSLSKLIIKLVYVITILLSDTSLAVSKTTQEQGRALPFYFLIKHKIKVVMNGIAMPNFLEKEKARELLSDITGVDLSSRKIIGQIAELHPIKSIKTTIEATHTLVQKYPNLAVVLIGDGQEKEKLQSLIVQSKLDNNVFLVGFVDNAAAYTKAFDLFLLTSKSEALPLVLLEAGLAQVPVIASYVGGIPEIIEDKHTGQLFESGNTQDCVSKIEYVLSMSDFEKEIVITNFYTKIQSDHTIDHMTEQTIRYY